MLWRGGVRWESDAGEHPHEARYLKVDSSRALEAIVEWYAGLRDGEDMRSLGLAQLEAFAAPINTLPER